MLYLILHHSPVVAEVFRSFTVIKVVKPQCKNTPLKAEVFTAKYTLSIKVKLLRILLLCKLYHWVIIVDALTYKQLFNVVAGLGGASLVYLTIV